MNRVFDIGMYDGNDTAYYMESGYQVTAVEANPALVDNAKRRFEKQIASGQLACVNAAISPNGEPVELNLSGRDLGSSSVFSARIADKRPAGAVTVAGVTLQELFERYGVPEYLKVDIEGSDRLCVLALTPEKRPPFLSFEIGDDVEELLSHIESIGYQSFKIVYQVSFRELANQHCLYDRVAYRLMKYMGYDQPRLVKRAGRFFVAGYSSGPFPWHGDGQWRSSAATRSRLNGVLPTNIRSGWYDIHARVE